MANPNNYLKGQLIEKDKTINNLKRQLAEKKTYTFGVRYETFMDGLVASTEFKHGEYVKYTLKKGGYIQFCKIAGTTSNIIPYLSAKKDDGLLNLFITSGMSYADIKFDLDPESTEIPVLDFLVLIKVVSDNFSKHFNKYGSQWMILDICEDEYYKKAAYCDYLTCIIVKDNYTIYCKHAHRAIYQSKIQNRDKSKHEAKSVLESTHSILRVIKGLKLSGKITNDERKEIKKRFFKTEWDIDISDYQVRSISDLRAIYDLIEGEVMTKHPNPVIIKQFKVKKDGEVYILKPVNDECQQFAFRNESVNYDFSYIKKYYGDFEDQIFGQCMNGKMLHTDICGQYCGLLPEELKIALQDVKVAMMNNAR